MNSSNSQSSNPNSSSSAAAAAAASSSSHPPSAAADSSHSNNSANSNVSSNNNSSNTNNSQFIPPARTRTAPLDGPNQTRINQFSAPKPAQFNSAFDAVAAQPPYGNNGGNGGKRAPTASGSSNNNNKKNTKPLGSSHQAPSNSSGQGGLLSYSPASAAAGQQPVMQPQPAAAPIPAVSVPATQNSIPVPAIIQQTNSPAAARANQRPAAGQTSSAQPNQNSNANSQVHSSPQLNSLAGVPGNLNQIPIQQIQLGPNHQNQNSANQQANLSQNQNQNNANGNAAQQFPSNLLPFNQNRQFPNLNPNNNSMPGQLNLNFLNNGGQPNGVGMQMPNPMFPGLNPGIFPFPQQMNQMNPLFSMLPQMPNYQQQQQFQLFQQMQQMQQFNNRVQQQAQIQPNQIQNQNQNQNQSQAAITGNRPGSLNAGASAVPISASPNSIPLTPSMNPPNFQLNPQLYAAAQMAQAQAQAQAQNRPMNPSIQPVQMANSNQFRPANPNPVPFVPGAGKPFTPGQNQQFAPANPQIAGRPLDAGQFPPKRPTRPRERPNALAITDDDGTPVVFEPVAPAAETVSTSTTSSPSITAVPAASGSVTALSLAGSSGEVIDTSVRVKQPLAILSPTRPADQLQPAAAEIPPANEPAEIGQAADVTAALTAQPVIAQKKPLLSLTPQPNPNNPSNPTPVVPAASSSPRSSLSHSQSAEFSTPSNEVKKPIKSLKSTSGSPVVNAIQPPVEELLNQLSLNTEATKQTPSANDSSPRSVSPSFSLSASSSILDLIIPKPILPARAADGRLKFDRSFLLSFSSIVQRPANFPTDLPSEILVDIKKIAAVRAGKQDLAGKNWNSNNSNNNSNANNRGQQRNFGTQKPAQQTPRSAGPQQNQNSPSSQGQQKKRTQPANTITPLTRVTAVKIDNRRGPVVSSVSSLPPVQPLNKTDNAWQPGKGIESEMDKVKKKCLALLNKLTREKFETISTQLIELIKSNVKLGHELLREVVTIMFDKALAEPFFASMYSDFCSRISNNIQEFEEPNNIDISAKKKNLFKVLLLNKCQEEFERGAQAVETSGKSEEEIQEEQADQKRRMLGNIRFIGELYKKLMLTEHIMHSCVHHLLLENANPTEEDIESLCNLLTTIGKPMDNEKSQPKMESYFDKLLQLSQNKKFPSRIRFMILDLIDLRKSNWIPRAKTVEAKSLEQIKKDSEAEAMAKRISSQSNQRTNMGGIMGKPGSMMPAAAGSRVAQDIRILTKTPIAAPQPIQAGAGPGSSKDRQLRQSSGGGQAGGVELRPQGFLRPGGGFSQQRFEQAGQTITIRPSSIEAPPTRSSPSPTSASPIQGSPAPFDAEAFSKSVKSLIVEYSVNRNFKEFKVSFDDFSRSEGNYLLVAETIEFIFDKRDSMELLTKLCLELAKLDYIQLEDFVKGIERATRNWEERLEDAPKAQEWIAQILARWIAADAAILNAQSLIPALSEIAKFDPFKVAEILGHLLLALTSGESGWSEQKIRDFISIKQFHSIVTDSQDAEKFLKNKSTIQKFFSN